MKAHYRILAMVSAAVGVSLGWLGLTYGRARVASWLDDSFVRLEERLVTAEFRRLRSGLPSANALDEATWRELEHLKRPRALLWGVHDGDMPRTFAKVPEFERFLGIRMRILQIYGGWGDAPEQAFPGRAVRLIWETGSVPLVTWEPWLSAFDAALHPSLRIPEKRDDNGLRDIAAGQYDFYIHQWADQAAAFGHPIFVRFAHEMNDSQRYPWGPARNPTPDDFKAAWRHVVSQFRQRGANNVLFVWAPSISYLDFERFFPGEEWVDWVGTGVLNFGTSMRWSKWQSCVELLQPHYPQLAAWGLPLMIAEFGSLADGGDRAKWYANAMERMATDWPLLKSVVFFNVRADRTASGEPLDWSIVTNTNSNVAHAVRDGLRTWFSNDPKRPN